MIRIPVARRSWPYILIALVFPVAGWFWSWSAGAVLAFPAVFIIIFFRDPKRLPPDAPPGVVLSPADGTVISIENSRFPDGTAAVRISIFIRWFDVHVMRVPIRARMMGLFHYPGRFLRCVEQRASSENERMECHLHTEFGPVLLVLIAGWFARRIVVWARPDDHLLRGQRFAMIKLGSRVDIHVPADTMITVSEGSRVTAGLTPLAAMGKPSPGDGEKKPPIRT